MAVKLLKTFVLVGLVAAFSCGLPLVSYAATVYGSDAYGSGTYAGSAPIVTTDSSSAISETGATLGGTIASIGSTSPSVRGFVYGANTSYGATTTDTTGAPFSTGSFSVTISSLTCNTGYHFAAYTTSSNGIGYGSDLTFMTSACSSGGGVVAASGGGGVISGPLSIGFHPGPQQPNDSSTGVSAAGSALEGAPSGTTSANPGSGSINFEKNRQLNDKGEDIRSLQKFLNLNGFIVASSGPGSMGHETSIFGLRTYRALIQFQSARGLPATGFLGPMTRGTINQRP
jgi:hypothetical protein